MSWRCNACYYVYLGVAAKMMQSPCADLKVLEQSLNVVSMSTEHVIKHGHPSLYKRVHKLTTILRHTQTRT